ncbi:unnamed protein product [Leptidea sinapis]|uniref:Uncharacterized protein n=1 Tax=Leptidea sinapis TaxID=189913 RepID=A0A5E4PLE6_9NEOP|nr:unnamed protein product [Leptidea sinapis]
MGMKPSSKQVAAFILRGVFGSQARRFRRRGSVGAAAAEVVAGVVAAHFRHLGQCRKRLRRRHIRRLRDYHIRAGVRPRVPGDPARQAGPGGNTPRLWATLLPRSGWSRAGISRFSPRIADSERMYPGCPISVCRSLILTRSYGS